MEQMDLAWMTNNFSVFLKMTTNIAFKYEQKSFHIISCASITNYIYAYVIYIHLILIKTLSVQTWQHLILKVDLNSDSDLKL